MWVARAMIALAIAVLSGCVVVHVNDPSERAGRLFTDVEMMRQAMVETRALGIAFESYAVDTNKYPTTTNSDRMIGGVSLSRIDALSNVLKIYARPFPKLDPWDSPYLFWSDGTHYALICLGADAAINRPGELAHALGAFAKGEEFPRTPSHCMEDDIVFANGSLVWWPRDPIRRCGHSGGDRE